MEKAAIFIDGGYLNKILKNCFDVNVNYAKLCEIICNELELKRLRTYYYHCMPIIRKGNKNDEIKHSKMQKFLSKLKRLPRFEIKLGRLQLVGGQFKQKMIDILMSLDIVNMCFDKQINHAILIAGDSDFVPAVKKAKEYGAVVHLYYHPSSVHNEILDEIDELHIISEELISKCKK
ncbi:MAG: NYN domain-containing protein [Nanoarchaeota archaeon]|nr:NYN domain-containing protein [Nanoarchaeota archaeon]